MAASCPGARQHSVSVVIPAYNAGACLERAVCSVLAQSHKVQEIILVDDGSLDDTAAVARKFGKHVRLMQQIHAGASAARNAGILAAQSTLVAFLDADDEWLPAKLERQLPLHQSDPVLSFSASDEFGFGGEAHGDTFGDWRPVRGNEAWKALLAMNFIATPTVIARRDDLLACGGFNRCLKVGEDQDLWIRLALRGELEFTRESLVKVHLRPDGLSSGPVQDQLDHTWPMVLAHLERLSPRLTPADLRRIHAQRLGRMGRSAVAQGQLGLALPMILRAMSGGDRPLHNIRSLVGGACRLGRGPAGFLPQG